jgi:hypothetical protein
MHVEQRPNVDLCCANFPASRRHNKREKISFLLAILVVAFGGMRANAQVKWTRNGAPTDVTITGGPWTLEQSGAAKGLKSSGYCDASLNQIGNPGTERMELYYLPEVFGFGKHLQGYFDWRPKDTDEGVVAASSDDAGQSWTITSRPSRCEEDLHLLADKHARHTKTRPALRTGRASMETESRPNLEGSPLLPSVVIRHLSAHRIEKQLARSRTIIEVEHAVHCTRLGIR